VAKYSVSRDSVSVRGQWLAGIICSRRKNSVVPALFYSVSRTREKFSTASITS
jgi:hypothetical protein